jgi:hypothetical protein
MLTMVSDWSTDRTGGPGAFPFTKAVAEAVLESETVTGSAQRTTARKTQEQVDNLSDASIAKWAQMDSSSSTLSACLLAGYKKNEDNKYLIDQPVTKMFDGKAHHGNVISFKPASSEAMNTWKIKYEDGDQEDEFWKDLMPILDNQPDIPITNEQARQNLNENCNKFWLAAQALSINIPKELECLGTQVDAEPGTELWWNITKSFQPWQQRWKHESFLAQENLKQVSSQLWNELKAPNLPGAAVQDCENAVNKFKDNTEMLLELNLMNKKSTSGLSGLTIAHCLLMPTAGLDILILITDCCLAGLFPDSYLLGASLGIGKSDTNWRPITLLEAPMKLVASSVNRRLMKTAYEHKLLSSNQFGNVLGGSTNSPLRMTISMYEQARVHGKGLHVSYLDLQTAFDCVPHSWLEAAIRAVTGSEKVARWVRNMCTGQRR